MKSLIDNWKGYYEFGFGYEPPIFGSRVNFNLFFTGKEDEFYGECIEENNENLINEISKIAGFVDNGLISFKKIYENTEVINEEGSIDFIKGREAVVFFTENIIKNMIVYLDTGKLVQLKMELILMIILNCVEESGNAIEISGTS